jgi:hypothetical protein
MQECDNQYDSLVFNKFEFIVMATNGSFGDKYSCLCNIR